MSGEPKDDKDEMTPAQREAVCKAWDLLCEHFDRCLLIVDFDSQDAGGSPCDVHCGYWHGGSLSGIGMAEFAKNKILSSSSKSNEPEDYT